MNRHRSAGCPFDVVASGATPTKDRGKAAEIVAPFEDAGATWWLEWLHDQRGTFEEILKRVIAGPPKI